MPDDRMVKFLSDAAHFRELIKHPGWERLLEYADKVESQAIEDLIEGHMPSDLQRGYVLGMRKAISIPAEVLQNAEMARN